MDCRSKERRRPISSNQCRLRVNLLLGRGNPHEERQEHFIRPAQRQALFLARRQRFDGQPSTFDIHHFTDPVNSSTACDAAYWQDPCCCQ
jgi:hypothetical protein